MRCKKYKDEERTDENSETRWRREHTLHGAYTVKISHAKTNHKTKQKTQQVHKWNNATRLQ